MSLSIRSKKMAPIEHVRGGPKLDRILKMVRIGAMSNRLSKLNRREILAGLGGAALVPVVSSTAPAQARRSLLLQAAAGTLALRPGQEETPTWLLRGPEAWLDRGEQLDIGFENQLPVPVVLNWPGMDGSPMAEPLAVRAPLAPGAQEHSTLSMRQAGTFMGDIGLLGDAQARPSRPMALIVRESEPVAVDRDEVLLIEDWRLRPDGTAIAPGSDPQNSKPPDSAPLYTINGQTGLDVALRGNQRLRLRFINGCHRSVVAVKLEGLDVRVMALDSQPSEPFLARNGALTLAPGSRVDVFVDATLPAGSISSILLHDGKQAYRVARLVTSSDAPVRPAPLPPAPPLPSNGLPAQLDLKHGLRFELAIGVSQPDWVTPSKFSISAVPAFRANIGRTVVLALTNRAEIATVFHLHGHHFRLLDRLDDGWKPFWLDTLAIEPGQTQRIAFAAEYAGHWLIEQVRAEWTAPRLLRWYTVV
jgi:FtsP/CotA-like multicopper oxidase with cupredoxin domain